MNNQQIQAFQKNNEYQILFDRLTSFLIKKGKKATAEKIVADAVSIIRRKVRNQNPGKILELALKNAEPDIELKSIKVSGRRVQVPVILSSHKRRIAAYKSLIETAKSRYERTMGVKLALEILDAYKDIGATIKKRNDLHNSAVKFRIFAHYRI